MFIKHIKVGNSVISLANLDRLEYHLENNSISIYYHGSDTIDTMVYLSAEEAQRTFDNACRKLKMVERLERFIKRFGWAFKVAENKKQEED